MKKPYGWKEFQVGELFKIETPKKKINANMIKFNGKYPYVARSSSNNGIRGYITESEEYLNPANTISFGQDTATMFYQDKPYFTGDKIKILSLLKCELNEKIACYLISSMARSFSVFAWGQTSFSEDVLKNINIFLPVTSSGDPDFNYMEQYISKLESNYALKLKDYLKFSGLEDFKLTDEDQDILSQINDGRKKFAEFRIGNLFEKLELKNKPGFDKRKDTSTVQTDEFNIPLVNAKHGDNGIMFYGRDSECASFEGTVGIIQNGVIATGDVYPHPERTGVLWDAYLIKPECNKVTREILCYMACALEKTIKLRFSYDDKATWDRVKEVNVLLPVTPSGSPDYDFMEQYIRIIEKQVIGQLYEYRKEEFETTKQVVSGR